MVACQAGVIGVILHEMWVDNASPEIQTHAAGLFRLGLLISGERNTFLLRKIPVEKLCLNLQDSIFSAFQRIGINFLLV